MSKGIDYVGLRGLDGSGEGESKGTGYQNITYTVSVEGGDNGGNDSIALHGHLLHNGSNVGRVRSTFQFTFCFKKSGFGFMYSALLVEQYRR